MRKKKEEVSKNLKRNSKSKNKHSLLRFHETKMESFKNKDAKISELNNKIKAIKKKLDKIDEHLKYGKIVEIEKLEKEKKVVESGNDFIEYLTSSSELIKTFYDLEQEEQVILNIGENKTQIEIDKLNNINKKKLEVSNDYFGKFNPGYTKRIRDNYANFSCDDCKISLDVLDGVLVCPDCGKCKLTIDNGTELSYKELQEYDIRGTFTYLKRSHLSDWIRRFCSQENKSVPQEILDKVIIEASKERMCDLSELTEDKVKKYLKKLGLNEYYDNVIGIINRINKRPPFVLSQEVEQKIFKMFDQIQEPFVRYKPANRKNFLSYSYCLHQFFKILGLPEFSKYFTLLKDTDKLRQQDDIFKKIVAEMSTKDKTINWVFYPTV